MAFGGEHAGERTGEDVFAHAPHAPSSSTSSGPADGDPEDMAAHRGNEQCWRHFDLGFLEDWDAAARMMCTPVAGGLWEGREGEMGDKLGPPYSSLRPFAPTPPPSQLLPSAPLSAALTQPPALFPPGWLRCRVMSDSHLPGPTAPHTHCDGANVYLLPALLTPTPCLPSRPGYKCAGSAIHWLYAQGALTARCASPAGAMDPEAFPRDHLRDMFGGWVGVGVEGAAAPAPAVPPAIAQGAVDAGGLYTLLVAREREEHANAFHATTDFLNAFQALVLAGVVDGATGVGDMGGVQVLLLDEQSGPFEELWYKRVFSPAHPLLRASALQAAGVPALRLRRALFVPPGYTNMLLSHVQSEGDCHAPTQLLQGFRGFVLRALGLLAGAEARRQPASAAAPVRITLVSRRPYSAAGIAHGFVGRQIDNEAELLAGLQAALAAAGLPSELQRTDLALLGAEEQVAQLALRTDVLVGMHGAGLTYAALLPPWAAVVELWPKQDNMWRCFEHLSAMGGLLYQRWANGDWQAWREDAAGDYTAVSVAEVAALVVKAAQHVVEKRV